MSQRNDGPTKAFTASGALGNYLRVRLNAGVLALAGAMDLDCIGNMELPTYSGATVGTVRLRNSPGTRKQVAAGAIAQGATLYAAASGKINDIGFVPTGEIALEAATADGDIIETLDIGGTGPAMTPEAVAAAGSAQGDAAALTGIINSVSGADGTKGVILPAASTGGKVMVYNEHATNGLKVYPATGDDINDAAANAAITMEGKGIAVFTALDGTTWAASYVINA